MLPAPGGVATLAKGHLEGAAPADGPVGTGPADCMRQHRQPAAGARSSPQDADIRAAGAGRAADASDPPVSDGERGVGDTRWSCRFGCRVSRHAQHPRDRLSRFRVHSDDPGTVGARDAVRVRARPGNRCGLRSRPSLDHLLRRSCRGASGRNPRHHPWRFPAAEAAGRRAGRDLAGTGCGRHSASAEPAQARTPELRLPERPPLHRSGGPRLRTARRKNAQAPTASCNKG